MLTDDYGHACVLQPDGKIILGGTNNKVHNYILARYNNNIQNKNPIARIKKWIEHHILHWQNLQAVDNVAYYTIEQSNNAASGFVQMAHIKNQKLEMQNPKFIVMHCLQIQLILQL